MPVLRWTGLSPEAVAMRLVHCLDVVQVPPAGQAFDSAADYRGALEVERTRDVDEPAVTCAADALMAVFGLRRDQP